MNLNNNFHFKSYNKIELAKTLVSEGNKYKGLIYTG